VTAPPVSAGGGRPLRSVLPDVHAGQDEGEPTVDPHANVEGTDLTVEVDLEARAERTDLHDPRRRVEVERSLAAIPGVIGARLVPGFEREVDELHVLTGLHRAPKQTVRDVQTLLMARFGVSTDHRVISVVQLDETVGYGVVPDRVIIEQVSVTHAGRDVTAEVRLREGDDELTGRADGANNAGARHHTIAAATLDAVRPLLGFDNRVALEGIDVVDVRGQRVAVSVMQLRTPRTELALSGCALVRDAEPDAIARSVLDALNRAIADPKR
jgi:hypothetical protein